MENHDIYIREITIRDIESLLAFELKNKKFMENILPTRHEMFYTYEGQAKRVETILTCKLNDLGYFYGIFLKQDDTFIGTVELFHVERGPLQSAWIGYSLDYNYQGLGYMTYALGYVLNVAFQRLQLHRIEAGAMPKNKASIKVLEKNGFMKEGLSHKNVKINGVWEDHFLYASINPNATI